MPKRRSEEFSFPSFAPAHPANNRKAARHIEKICFILFSLRFLFFIKYESLSSMQQADVFILNGK
ncbi:hypothetical protein DQM68_09445 [Leptospira mayottensis]|uniref:Uncharacterized protein n=1 Tax=Leptospira mayottensis TaxID=1137606 RepID=A0ABN5NXA3_9LEPT|nr:hypothetical protein B9T54_05580 [Leptospira borgpetersenii serovar Hardjo-bovis]AXR62416.1 hypothetical protein DQM68_09445 [Leptospira mayottensis]AZQ03826.1 hypothetical protein LEP1GSC190_12245 [Leptospira mayottensis 200901116]TQE51144.1 hypothetical protein FFZ95_15485 [Leptospira borgpetersenii]AXR66144.1 hypothetical protein DQM28_11485 [Leptospira mayottensis]